MTLSSVGKSTTSQVLSCWVSELSKIPIEKVQTVFRSFFLPLHKEPLPKTSLREAEALLNPSIDDPWTPDKKEILIHFPPQEKTFELLYKKVPFRITTHYFASDFKETQERHVCLRFGGNREKGKVGIGHAFSYLSAFLDWIGKGVPRKNLTFIQANHYDIQILKGNKWETWKPPTDYDLACIHVLLMEKLHSENLTVETVIAHSYGSNFCSALDILSNPKACPKNFFFSRSFTSVRKMGKHFTPSILPGLDKVIQLMATWSGWNNDPEYDFFYFFIKHPKWAKDRRVSFVDLKETDFYFSRRGARSRNWNEKLNQTGFSAASQEIIEVGEHILNARAHHNIPTKYLVFGPQGRRHTQFNIMPYETVASFVTRHFILNPHVYLSKIPSRL